MKNSVMRRWSLAALLAVPYAGAAAIPPAPGGNPPPDPETGLSMTDAPDLISVRRGALRLSLDKQTGAITHLSLGPKTLIAPHSAPPVFATVMESDAYTGLADCAPRTLLPARYALSRLTPRLNGTEFVATGNGTLEFPGGDAIDFTMTVTLPAVGERLATSLSFRPRGAFRNRFIREIGLRQPLALEFRKRVIQAGDQGLWWDTRHHYQFHSHVGFLAWPDSNWWRHFYVDQETGHSYRLWRAESEDTAGLEAFRGRQAAGWMTVYDQTGGVLFAYRRLAERAPKCLYVNAERGAEGVVYFLGPMHAARAVSDPALRSALFNGPHDIDWIFFLGEQARQAPDRTLAAAWGVERLRSDGPARMDPVDDELTLFNAAEAGDELTPLVAGGLPLPRGSVRDPAEVRVFLRGRETPAQTQALAYWPDRSIKWLSLIFPLDGDGGYRFTPGTGEGVDTPFTVTLRQGAPVTGTLRYGPAVRRGTIGPALATRGNSESVTIDTGPLSLRLSTGECWLARATLMGREMLREEAGPQAYVDFLRPAGVYPVGTTHPEGIPDPGPVRIAKVEIEEAGPLRAVVRLEGLAMAREPARVILRVEAYAARPYVRLFHTVEFLQKDPRRVFVQRMGVRLPLALDGRATTPTAGGQGGPVPLPPAAVTGLRQTGHLNYEIWQTQDHQPWREIRESGHRSRGWLAVGDRRGGLVAVARDMWQESPKELSFHRKETLFDIGLWPETAPLMDVRRYSNYPHRGQGESVTDNPRWVLDSYYARDPFVGVSKTHEMLLFFHRGASPAQMDAVAADFQSRPLIYAGWPAYAGCGITMPLVDPADPAFAALNSNMLAVADWWLFHQRAWGWYGFWDYGDVQHRHRSGYGDIYAPADLARILKMPPAERQPEALRSFKLIHDYFTQNDWAFDNGRWGWSNTEGLINHFMSLQYLRTGRRDLFFFMEANARHVRDVDARHAGAFFGRGTRHGVQHWSDGNHEERQTTFTEQRFHYLLTGEHRTREWNRVLSENHYLKGRIDVHAAHSGRSYGLLTFWELTGDPAIGETLRNYMHALAQPGGVDIQAPVQFPEGTPYGPPKDLHGGSMFFHAFGGMHALLEYYYLTQDERVRQSLVATAAPVIRQDPDLAGGMLRKVVAFAARHAPEGAPYRAALEGWLTRGGQAFVFQQVPSNRDHWAGELDFLAGNVSGGLFWANDAFYTCAALAAEPELTPRARERLRQAGERPLVPRSREPRESWQSDYDRPEFRDYTREHLRPESKPH